MTTIRQVAELFVSGPLLFCVSLCGAPLMTYLLFDVFCLGIVGDPPFDPMFLQGRPQRPMSYRGCRLRLSFGSCFGLFLPRIPALSV